MEFEQELIDIIKLWSESKIWRPKEKTTEALEERKAKFVYCHEMLNRYYQKNVKLVFKVTPETDAIPGSSGRSGYSLEQDTIYIIGRLSAITFLHEWAHALGMNQEQANEYSLGLFKIGFPNSHANLKKIPGSPLVVGGSDEVPVPEGIGEFDSPDPENDNVDDLEPIE